MPKESGKKLISQNRKARHDYFVDETYEAGIALSGTEVKSIRAGAVNLKDSYCRVEDGELWASGIHVSPYEKGRKLLMHKREIMKLGGLCARDGYTLVPLSVYLSGSHVKVELGLCRGKKLYDKREADAKKQAGREIEREMKERSR